jgi:uncharacterized membrane protein
MLELVFGLGVLLLGAGVTLVLPIVLLLRALRTARQIDELRTELASLRASVQRLEQASRQAVAAASPAGEQVEPAGATTRVEPDAPGPEPPPSVEPVAPPALPAPPVQAQDDRLAAAAAAPAESLETRIGSRWLLYIGVLAIVVGASYFLKYAFENEWITETARVLIGAAGGLALAGSGLRFTRRGYVRYGQIVAGGGIAILYLCTYAAFNVYDLIGAPAALVLMASITAATAALADAQRSQGLAIMAVGGGFLTPFMFEAASDPQHALFGFELALVGGTTILALRRGWPALNLLAFAFTVVTISLWADAFYTRAAYLRTEVYLTAFCVLFLVIRRAMRRTSPDAARILLLAPILYHLSSLLILFPHSLALLVYLIAFAAITMIGVGRGSRGWRRPVLWAAVALPFLAWLTDHTTPGWRAAAIATIGAIYLMHLLAQLEVVTRGPGLLPSADVALIHANGLWLFAATYLLVAATNLAMVAPAGGALTALNAALAWAVNRYNRPAALHFVALAAVLGATSVAIEFDGAWVTLIWAAEGCGVLWLGLREERRWLTAGGLLLVLIGAVRVALLLAEPTAAAYVPLLNPRTGTSLAVVGLIYVAAAVRRQLADSRDDAMRTTLVVVANVLTIGVISAEIRDFWTTREAGASGRLAQQASLSIAWAAYAVVLIVAGIRARYPPIRYLAIVVLGATILKVFAVDLSELDRIYRILSIVALGALLLVTSYLYQRYRSRIEAPDEAR